MHKHYKGYWFLSLLLSVCLNGLCACVHRCTHECRHKCYDAHTEGWRATFSSLLSLTTLLWGMISSLFLPLCWILWASWPATSGWVSHLHVHLSVERCDYSMSLPHLSFRGCSGDEMQVSGGTESALTPEFSYRLLLGVAAAVCPHRKVLGEVHSLLWTLWKSWCWVDTISSLNIEQTSLWLCGSADFIYRRFLITLTFHSQTWDYLDYLSVLA